MTLPKRSLHPASGDYRRALLSALEFVASGTMQLAEVVRTVVCQCMTLEPRPQVFDRVHVWRVWRQECDMDVSVQTVQIIAHQTTAVSPQAVPDHQQGLLQMGLERFEKFHDLFLFDAALVQPKQTVGARQSCNHRDMVPVEMKLDDGCLTFERPSAHPCRSLAYPGLVDKNNYSAFSLGFFSLELVRVDIF